MKSKALLILSLLALIVALPLVLRRQSQAGTARGADETLVVLTPHNESILKEFGEAFATYWRQTTGRSVYLDWRSPGGASEIRMVLDAGYKAARETGPPFLLPKFTVAWHAPRKMLEPAGPTAMLVP